MRPTCLQKTVVTWGEWCESAALACFNRCAERTAMVWHSELHKTKNQIKVRRSLRGRESSAANSPFLEDKRLMLKFKAWARDDLKHVTVCLQLRRLSLSQTRHRVVSAMQIDHAGAIHRGKKIGPLGTRVLALRKPALVICSPFKGS
jgi:hypothetical protein